MQILQRNKQNFKGIFYGQVGRYSTKNWNQNDQQGKTGNGSGICKVSRIGYVWTNILYGRNDLWKGEFLSYSEKKEKGDG